MSERAPLQNAEQTLEAAQPKRHAAYPAYRPSGVDWLGDVPQGWDVKRLKFLSRLNPNPSELAGIRAEEGVSFVPMDAVHEYGGLRLDTVRPLEEVKSGFTYFRDGDVVVAKITPCFENGKGSVAVGLTNGIAFGTTELHVVRSSSLLDRTLTISDPFRKLGAAEMYGAGGQKRVPTDFVRDFPVAFPGIDEQQAIARFLDEQTEKIDDLIEAKRDLLALLKEKRQAVISRAVTKGLNPDASLKPSGVDWLGDVPKHWDVLPVRRRTNRLQTGSTPPTQEEEYYENGSVAWYGPSSFSEAVAIGSPVKSINAQAVRDGVARLFAADSVLVVTIGATLGKIAWLPEAASTNQQITAMTFDSRRVFGKFAAYQLKSVEQILRSIAPSATLPILDQQEVASIPMAFPPRDEQEAIVAHLDMEVGKLDSIIAETQRAIERLVELRTGVISAAITGKIDVRGGTT